MTAAQLRRLADQIRRAVRNAPISQNEIARRAGVDRTGLSKFMNGERGLSFESLEKLAPVLGLEITTKQTRKGKA